MSHKILSILMAVPLLLAGVVAVEAISPTSAFAASSVNNNAIADKAASYNNRWGGAASVDSGTSGYTGGAPLGDNQSSMDGECRAFVNAILKMTLGINTAYGSDYQQAFRDNGGEPISAIGGMRGDVIQVGNGVHTAIIDRYLGNNVYQVWDSNYVAYHKVGTHQYTLPSSGAQIWRMATVHVAIRSLAANRYVSTELGYSGNDYAMLRARATGVGGWELFTLKGDCSQACAIRSDANNQYVSEELGYQGYAWAETRARSGSPGSWEQFHFQGNCYTGCAIQSLATKKFITVELNYTGNGANMLRGRSDSAQAWEQFTVF